MRPTAAPTYGFCKECNRVHSLPEGPARAEALALFATLKREQRLDYEIPASRANPLFSTSFLYNERCGQMFGVLVGLNAQGERVTLKAFSSQHSGEWSVPGWVEPLVPSKLYLAKMRRGAIEITAMTHTIENAHCSDTELQALKRERKGFSQNLMKELHGLYRLHNFKGENASLDQAYIASNGMPTGTGDCCAPKLLNAAAKEGISPLGISEFFLGRDSLNGSKIEGEFYPACTEKCQPILGFLLCGVENQSPQE